MVKLMMQDTMYTMTVNSCYNFVETIKQHIPAKVEVKSPDLVFNEFELTEKQK